MISSVQAVTAAFEAESASVKKVRLLHFSPENFGNWVVDVETTIGRFHLIRDRGQVFVDGFHEDGTLVRGEALRPALVPVYRKGAWSMEELVEIVVRRVHACG